MSESDELVEDEGIEIFQSLTDFKDLSTASTISDFSYYSSPICTIRRALDQDIREIESIIPPNTLSVFGNITVEAKIKKCFYSMVALNADGKIVAVIVLDDHPNIPALPKSEWETWIVKLYGLCNLTTQNTLWIHLLASQVNYTYTFIKPLLEQVYSNFPYLIYIVLVLPSGVPCFCFIEENFTRVMPPGYTNPHKVQTLYLTLRYQYIPKYKIRLAVEEDNDDIVEIIDTHSQKLRELYGDFYVSEILTKFTYMKRKLIVAEYAERAVGVLFLNEDMNYKQLIENFNLEPFTNLHKIEDTINIIYRKVVLENESDSLDQNDTADLEEPKEISPAEVSKANSCTMDSDELSMFQILELDKFGFLIDSKLSDEAFLRTSALALDEETNTQVHSFFRAPSKAETAVSEESFASHIKFELIYKKRAGFVLEIMAAKKEHEKEILCDLLEASFQSFSKKSKEYCVFSTTHTVTHFPLFDYFVRAVPKWNSIYPRELYVLHKNSIKACLKVKKLSRNDYTKVQNLISHIAQSTVLLDAITKSLFGVDRKLKTYVIYNYTVLIGFMIVRVEDQIKQFFEQYQCHKYVDLAVHRYDRYGVIQHCIFSPIFQKHMQFFLREVHRISDMSILFYLLSKNDVKKNTRTKPLPAILKDMIPVMTRVQPKYNHINMPEITPPACTIHHFKELHSAFISTRRLCSLPRIDINSRIVVVGYSITSLAFLESLISHFDGEKHVCFNNLFLVYDNSNSFTNYHSFYKLIPTLFMYSGKYHSSNLTSSSSRSHVNYISGVMSSINRKLKYISVNKETILPYDYLFLMCGTQYHQPFAHGVRRDKITDTCPRNLFVINHFNDAERAFSMIHAHIKKKKPKQTCIIVYGSNLQAYACLGVLERMHLPFTSIKFVEPLPDETQRPSMDPFNYPALHDAFQDILFLIGIEVYTGYYFFEWEIDQEDQYVKTVKYQSRKGAVNFNCDFIFHYANKEVKYNTFTAINNAGLVYDGKIVIAPDCRTNDPFIYAAGSMTKYSRRYFADRYLHKYYSSNEIGERLGRQIRAMLLPGGLKANKGDDIYSILENSDTNKLVPQYKDPIVEYCQLAGGINYLNICNPGKPVPMEIEKNVGIVYETGSLKRIELDDDPEYFRIQFDKSNKVKQIVCFTRQDIEVENYQRLWGQHEQYLNNLFARFNKGLISNLYEYFRSPYFCALYLDKFNGLKNDLQNILSLFATDRGKSIIEDVVVRLISRNWTKLSTSQQLIIKAKFVGSDYPKLMVNKIMNFLGENVEYLPMYAHPLITNMILYDVETSPLFQGEEESEINSEELAETK